MRLEWAREPVVPTRAIPFSRVTRRGKATVAELSDIPKREFGFRNATISAFVSPGRGDPVLLIHGNSSCKEIWAHQLRFLAERGRPFVSLDLPGHGQSSDASMPHNTYSFPGYAAVIGELMHCLDWRSVDIVGWSLGGHIGLELLATDPRVRSLLIAGTPPVRPSPRALAEGFYVTDDMQLAGKKEFSASDARRYASQMLGGEHLVAPQLLRSVARTDGNARHYMLQNALSGVGADARRTVETTSKPLCVVHGEHEPFVRLNYLRSVQYRTLWSGSICLIRSAGHAPHWQTPDAFNAVLSSFLYSESSKSADEGTSRFALAQAMGAKS